MPDANVFLYYLLNFDFSHAQFGHMDYSTFYTVKPIYLSLSDLFSHFDVQKVFPNQEVIKYLFHVQDFYCVIFFPHFTLVHLEFIFTYHVK